MSFLRKVRSWPQLFMMFLADMRQYIVARDLLKSQTEDFSTFFEFFNLFKSIPRHSQTRREILLDLMKPYVVNFHQCALLLDEIHEEYLFEQFLVKAKNLCANREEQYKLKLLIATHGFHGSKLAQDILHRKVKGYLPPRP